MEKDGINDSFAEYKKLNIQLKELEKLYNDLVQESDELNSRHDYFQNEISSIENDLNEKKKQIYLSKMDYISKRYYRHSRNVFGLSFLIPYMAGTILAMFNFYYFALSKLVLGSLFVSLVISGIEGVLFDKKNKNKYARDYYNSEEYSKLKHELDKLEDDLKLKSQEFNNIILVIQKHNNQLDNTKTKYNDVKNRISGLVEDTFRVMYETQSLNFDEKHQEDKHEQSGPVKKLTPRNS